MSGRKKLMMVINTPLYFQLMWRIPESPKEVAHTSTITPLARVGVSITKCLSGDATARNLSKLTKHRFHIDAVPQMMSIDRQTS